MTRDLTGVQTWHDYAATTEHGALYTETLETRVNGETVPGQSTRTTTWITAEGQRVREESYALLTGGEWALTDSASYEFDTQNRWVKRTAGNGRITERELMCDGRLLWDIDENGVRMDYAYDTARQLVETTRSAVMDGETVITPETITTYTLGCGGAHPLYAPGYGGHDDQRKLGVRLAGEDNFLYGRPGTSHHLRLQRRRSDDDANHSLREPRSSRATRRTERSWKNPARDSGISSIPSTWLPTAFGPSRKPSPGKRKPNCSVASPTVPGKFCARAGPTPSGESFTRGTPITPRDS